MDHKNIYKKTEDMESGRNGDTGLLIEDLMERYGSDLKKLAFSYVRDWGKAEDLVQEVYFSCYKKIHTFRGDSSIKTWLYRITVNRCKDRLKSWPFRHIHIGHPEWIHRIAGSIPTPEDEMARKDENQQLAERVMALPLKYREVIILYYYSGLKTEEIADSLNQKGKTVRTRLHRARELLKKMYEEAGDDGR